MSQRVAAPGTIARWWPHTTDARIASFRLRCLRIVEHLRGQGVNAALYRRAEAPPPRVLVLSKRYDAATVAHALQCRAAGTRVVLDLCDNHFHYEGADPSLERPRRRLAPRSALSRPGDRCVAGVGGGGAR
jgi:hypothetical protein